MSSGNGGDGKNYGTGCPADENGTTFDDSAAASIMDGTAPFPGSYRPEGSLAVFNGKTGGAVNGTWKFHVVDNALLDDGAIQCVTVTIDTCGDAGCCPDITISPSVLPDGTKDSAYGPETLTGNGGVGPYSFAVTSGSLPPGLTLTGDEISGTPTAAGSYSFTITATDDNGCEGSQAYTVNIIVPYLLLSTFDGGSGWVTMQGNVSESGGNLNLSGNKAGTEAPNPWPPSNTFGCADCLIEFDDVVVGLTGQATLEFWMADNNNKVQVILKANGKVTFKQFVGGTVVVSQDFKNAFTPGSAVDIGLSYVGAQFELSINGVAQPVIPTSTAPSPGNAGISSKKANVSVGEVRISALN